MQTLGACFGACFRGERPGDVCRPKAMPQADGDCCAKLREEAAIVLQDGLCLPDTVSPALVGTTNSRQGCEESSRVEQKMGSAIADTYSSSPAPPRLSLCSLRPEVRPELVTMLVSANSFSKVSFHSPSVQLPNVESTASLGSGTIALISDVRVSIAGERQAFDCGPIAVKLSTLEQLLASVTEPLWVGQGAQGAVLKAQWRSGGCTVAVKWLVSDGGDLPAAYMEAVVAKLLAHPFLVQTFEYGMCQLDDTFDNRSHQSQEHQNQQNLRKGLHEGQHRGGEPCPGEQLQQEAEQEPVLQTPSQHFCPYALDSLGRNQRHSHQRPLPLPQQLQVPAGGQPEASNGVSNPPSCPDPSLCPGEFLSPSPRSSGVAGCISSRGGCCDAASCNGASARGATFDMGCPRGPTHGPAPLVPAPHLQDGVSSRSAVPGVDPRVDAAPPALEVLAACQDSFDGGGTPAGSRPVDCIGVLKQLGAAPGKYVVQIVSEWCDEGTLHAAIRCGVFKPQPPGPGQGSGRSRTWALRALLRTAREVAQGMSHLHSLNIIHGDLKPGNVLLKSSRIDSRGFVAKVADFGLSRLCSQREEFVATADWGTVPYMAGEYLDNRLCKSSDVYSFGVLLWQMYTGKTPFAGHLDAQVAVGVMLGNLHLDWPPNMPPPLLRLGQACCRHRPEQRPTFKEVVVALMGIETQVRDAHARAKLAMRRGDMAALAAHQAPGSCGGGACSGGSSSTTTSAMETSARTATHLHGTGTLHTVSSGGPAWTGATTRQQACFHYHQGPTQHPHQCCDSQTQQQQQAQCQWQCQAPSQQLQQQYQTQQCSAPTDMAVGCNNSLGQKPARLLDVDCHTVRPAQSMLLLGSRKVGVLEDTCSSELPAEPPDSGAAAAAAPLFMSTATNTVTVVAAGAAPAMRASVWGPPPPSPPPYLQGHPLQRHMSFGRFIPASSTSRMQIRTSFVDVVRPSNSRGGDGGGDGDGDLDVSSIVQDTSSPPTLLDSVCVHKVSEGRAAPPPPPPSLSFEAAAAAGPGDPAVLTCSCAADSLMGTCALSPMSSSGTWAASFFSPATTSAVAAAAIGRGGPVMSAALAAAVGISSRTRAGTPAPAAVVAMLSPLVAHAGADAASPGATADLADCPVGSASTPAVPPAEAPDAVATGTSSGCTARLVAGWPGPACAAAVQNTLLTAMSEQPPPLLALPPFARSPPCTPPLISPRHGVDFGGFSTESSEYCARGTAPGLSTATPPPLQLADIQRYASLPAPLQHVDSGGGFVDSRGRYVPAFATLPSPAWYPQSSPRLEQQQQLQAQQQEQQQQGEPSIYQLPFAPSGNAALANGSGGYDDGGGLWTTRAQPPGPSDVQPPGLLHHHHNYNHHDHHFYQQQQQAVVEAAVWAGRAGGTGAAAVSQPGFTGTSTPAAAALHRRPRSALGFGSAPAAAAATVGATAPGITAGRRGSGGGPMPYSYGSTGIAASRHSLEESPSAGFGLLTLIPLAPLHESVEGPCASTDG